MRGGLPTALGFRAPVPVTRYFATGDNDPCFIPDIRVTVVVAAAPVARPQQHPPPPMTTNKLDLDRPLDTGVHLR